MNTLKLSPEPASEVLYPKGSIVVCRECGKPIYRLQASIYWGEPVGKSAWKYVPVTVSEIMDLAARMDLDAGVRAAMKITSAEEWAAHCETIPTVKPGDFMDCPSCRKSFSVAATRPGDDAMASFSDRGYQVQLSVIPPFGKSRPIYSAH
jgi:hypothetical protein